jgi:hypothetical protein
MKTAYLTILALACSLTARADFSYTQTRKSASGMAGAAASAAGNQTSKHYMKGQKMKTDSGSTALIMDFEAQTITTINNDQKTYTVTKFADTAEVLKKAGADVSVDVKETGQRKTVNGFNASQVMMTMSMEGMQGAPPGTKMVMEMEMWISSDVPGAQESRAFFQKNGGRIPWASMGAGANPQMQKSMAEMQKKVAALGGVPVMQIVRMKMGGAGGDAQMQQMQGAMAQAMARMEEMKKQGGEQAKMAEQMMARMGGARGAGGGGGSLFEVTMESSGFSTASIPDSVFAIPDGYQKK